MYTESLFLHVVKHNLLFLLWFFFFPSGFFSRISTIHRTVDEGGDYLLISFLPLPPASLHISCVIAAESSPLHIAGSRNRTWNWKLSLEFTLSALTLVAAVVRRMLKTRATLGNISRVLLNLTKRYLQCSKTPPPYQCSHS